MCCFHSCMSVLTESTVSLGTRKQSCLLASCSSHSDSSPTPVQFICMHILLFLWPYQCHKEKYLHFEKGTQHPLISETEKIVTLTSCKLTSENVSLTLFPKPLSPLNASYAHSSSTDHLSPAPEPLTCQAGAGAGVHLAQENELLLTFGCLGPGVSIYHSVAL